MQIDWNEEKNKELLETRGVGFEYVKHCIISDAIMDTIQHHNTEKFSHQKILVFEFKSYIHYCPFVKNGDTIFLKTIIPSRKLTKKYTI